ncbi:hypothetical protein ACQ858_14890 [Variovorax ureilyticus]|uniref:hypothetical protein n=1 Tax=Variovorax ureilyticus TaxID=1836198 RepID=UPI003D67C0A1
MIRVVEWAVLQLPADERYLMGVNRNTREAIISAPLKSFSPEDRLVDDSDGQSYELTDIGLVSVPARRAWRHWCRERGEPEFVEVTEEYEAAISAAAQLKATVRGHTDEGIDTEEHEQTALLRKRQLVADGHLVASNAMSSFLGGPIELLEAISRGRVFYVEVDGTRFYPTFFLDKKLNPARVERVMRKLVGLDVWGRYQFFTTPQTSLDGMTPIDALKHGLTAQVEEAAEGLAER